MTSFKQVTKGDMERFKRFYHAMLDEGVYLSPSAFEAGFVSASHGDRELKKTLEAFERALSK